MPSDESAADALGADWLDLKWSAWMPLVAAHPLALQQLSEAPGLFRIRREREICTLHVVAAPNGVREAVDRLSRQVRLHVPPATGDGLANLLWQEIQQTGRGYQVSGAVAPGPVIARFASLS